MLHTGDEENKNDIVTEYPAQAILLAQKAHMDLRLERMIQAWNNTFKASMGQCLKQNSSEIENYVQSIYNLDHRKSRVYHSYSGMLLQAQEYREKLLALQKENPSSRVAALELLEHHVSVSWDENTSNYLVQLNRLRIPYGFTYRSPSSRLVLLPSTEKYMFAVFAALRSCQTRIE